jgi:hypothetical protein
MEPVTRRGFGALSLSALAWLASGRGMATEAKTGRPHCLIVLWLRGGPSQIETFDPKPGKRIGGPTKAIATRVKGIELAEGLPLLAEQMEHISLVRSVVGKEGDHERASILMKTGRRPDVVLTHPAIGAVCAHELAVAGTEIPRYVSILNEDRTSRGGYLGQAYDPFRIGDPRDPLQDVVSGVGEARDERRKTNLALLEESFAQRHPMAEKRTLHNERTARALRTMSSEQLAAFRIEDETAATRAAYGDTPFGRGCLAARRLVEQGVRGVEVTLGGWDTHIDNFDAVAPLNRALDPAFAALVADLRERDLLSSTTVVCMGEFGRTPIINQAEGRDHWPNGFSLALCGGALRGGQVIGETSDESEDPADPVPVADVYATVLKSMGLDPDSENLSPEGRPIKLSEGKPIAKLLA